MGKWVQPEAIILSEVNQAQKHKGVMFSFADFMIGFSYTYVLSGIRIYNRKLVKVNDGGV